MAIAGEHAPEFLGERPARASFWSDGDTYLRRVSSDGEPTYNTFTPPDDFIASWFYWTNTVPFGGRGASAKRFFRAVFEGVPTAVAERSSATDRPRYRLFNDASTPRSDARYFRSQFEPRNVRSITLDASVDDRGIVRSFHNRYLGEVDDVTVTVQRSVDYAAINETAVGRPTWYDRAIDE
ncbi:hypothetical protein ACFO5R_09415 [Halosolutus amylolyticus]|uniref:DUF2961 domain-containing protein n=1 Tax=Halosolutus amylolyticus TaxID=2932267 RepID=A0ABD5PNH2_9EURY|nr:hypothetical protein [Halosolutus amylolyticus]